VKRTLKEWLDAFIPNIKKTALSTEQVTNLNTVVEIAKNYFGEDEVITTPDIIAKMKAEVEEVKYLSGWRGLDEILKGFRPTQLVTLTGLTKHGKTTFAMDLASRMKPLSPLWFSFEETPEELIRKFLDRREEPPLFCAPSSIKDNSMFWLETKIIESIAKYGTKVVFIDHLDFLVPYSEDRNDLRIADTVRALKAMARRWNVTIFLLCHLVKARMDTMPTINELRGSAAIAQESDTVLIIWRETTREKREVKVTNNTVISVQANRRTGSTGNVKMVFKNGHFVEEDWAHAEEEDAESAAMTDLMEKM
jgi:replicative DNA helicase